MRNKIDIGRSWLSLFLCALLAFLALLSNSPAFSILAFLPIALELLFLNYEKEGRYA